MRLPFLRPLVVSVALLTPLAVLSAKVQNDKRAKSLSALLKPAPMEPGKAEDIASTSAQLVKVLEALYASAKSNGPSPSDLLDQAYDLREDIQSSIQAACQANISRQFKQAELLGLFSDSGHLGRRITKGRDRGKDVVFEHIVPVPICPEFSRSLANIRFTGPSDVRKSDRPQDLDARTVEVAKRFRKVVAANVGFQNYNKEEADRAERKEGLYDMGMTKEEHDTLWTSRVTEREGILDQKPRISGSAKKTRRLVGYGRHELLGVVTNLSEHPTQVEVEFRIIGAPPGGGHLVLATHKETIKLLEKETRRIPLSGNSSPKARYQGWSLNVYHDREYVSSTSSSPTIQWGYGKKPN